MKYNWPAWLNKPREKQRLIWAYKILFLDVLFPLDVKKIIFVDADQIVRADLKELVDLDLEGAPYGYTPFCNSRYAQPPPTPRTHTPTPRTHTPLPHAHTHISRPPEVAVPYYLLAFGRAQPKP